MCVSPEYALSDNKMAFGCHKMFVEPGQADWIELEDVTLYVLIKYPKYQYFKYFMFHVRSQHRIEGALYVFLSF